MDFIKRTAVLILFIAFTQANSQELRSANMTNHDDPNEMSDLLHKESDNRQSSKTSLIHGPQDGIETDNQEQRSLSLDEEDAVPIEFLAPDIDVKYKRGSMIEVRWTGGNPEDEYALDLFDGRFHYRHIGELKNSGIYPWIIPMDVAPGKEYKFKLTNTEDFGEAAFSNTFTIKRKVPVAAWIIPGAVVVGGGVFLILFLKPEPDMPDLPPPIEPN